MAFLAQVLFLPHEKIGWNSLLGAGVILLCVLLITLNKIFKIKIERRLMDNDSLNKETPRFNNYNTNNGFNTSNEPKC